MRAYKVTLEQSNTPEVIAEGVWTVLKVAILWVILLMPEQSDVYYLFYNMIRLMTGHYQNCVLGNINAWSRVRSQSIIILIRIHVIIIKLNHGDNSELRPS